MKDSKGLVGPKGHKGPIGVPGLPGLPEQLVTIIKPEPHEWQKISTLVCPICSAFQPDTEFQKYCFNCSVMWEVIDHEIRIFRNTGEIPEFALQVFYTVELISCQ
jgi:hypothetical protein